MVSILIKSYIFLFHFGKQIVNTAFKCVIKKKSQKEIITISAEVLRKYLQHYVKNVGIRKLGKE